MGRSRLTAPLGRRALFCVAMTAFAHGTRAAPAFASIGSGEISAVYYAVAIAICEIANAGKSTSEMLYSTESTPGSAYNMEGLRSGDLEFALAQSSTAFAATTGRGLWRDRADPNLRCVLRLFPELLTIIVRDGSQIRGLADLAGKRVNVGGQGSGIRAAWLAIEKSLDWAGEARSQKMAMRTGESGPSLCKGDIDATIVIIGQPSQLVRDDLARCATRLVPLEGSEIGNFLRNEPYFYRSTIQAQHYGLPVDVPTVGSDNVLMTSASVDARMVAALAKKIITNIDALRLKHPALANLKVSEMISAPFPAPLHPGAIQAFKELGLAA